jgi:hypothetical protein
VGSKVIFRLVGWLLLMVFGLTIGQDAVAEENPTATAVQLDPATTATGRVITSDGAPISGALLDPSPLDGQEWAAFDSLRTTDSAGRYQLPLGPGRWDVSVSADGYLPTTLRITVPLSGLVETDIPLRRS